MLSINFLNKSILACDVGQYSRKQYSEFEPALWSLCIHSMIQLLKASDSNLSLFAPEKHLSYSVA